MSENNTHKLPFIAIIGKPNVGKSSLFNRLVRQKVAITSDEAGTTRDRVFRRCQIEDINAILVDTGGLEHGKQQDLEGDMHTQAKLAIAEADIVLFLVNGQVEPTIDDQTTAQILRKKSKNVIIIANKVDNDKFKQSLVTWTELGFGQPIPISVIHNLGMERMEAIIYKHLSENGWTAENTSSEDHNGRTKLAIIGRPNAGKSSLVNAILGQERVIVSEVAGTTRDAIDVDFDHQGAKFTLIDTAGLRRRGKIEKGIEKYSSFRTINAIERADIVCLVLDYEVGVRAQDLHISSYILDSHKGLIILINKIDLMENKEEERDRIGRLLKRRFDYLSWAPVLFVSAKNKKNLSLIMDTAASIESERNKQIDHDELTDFIRLKYRQHQPSVVGRNKVIFYDLTQTGIKPPSFKFIVNDADNVHFSYQRYLENQFREKYGFQGTTINFIYETIDKKLARKAKPL